MVTPFILFDVDLAEELGKLSGFASTTPRGVSPEDLQFVRLRYEFLRRLHIPDTAHEVGAGGNGLSPVVHLLPTRRLTPLPHRGSRVLMFIIDRVNLAHIQCHTCSPSGVETTKSWGGVPPR